MTELKKHLEIGSSPHIMSSASVDVIMRNVLFALLPVAAFSVYVFGLTAALVLAVATSSCIVTEYLLCRVTAQTNTASDWSVAITGLLYGLTLPPAVPLWMVAIGGIFAVAVGKFLFGGLGSNPFNPALVGRAFLQAAFPQAMTHWSPSLAETRFVEVHSSTLTLPFSQPAYDAVSMATPLTVIKFDGPTSEAGDLLLGFTSGSLGETSAALILLGGIYLVLRNMMNWRIPVSIFATVALITYGFNLWSPDSYPTPGFMLLSGGLMLGAVFMATDLVASPITNAGCWLYGLLIGGLVVVIRFWGAMPEGVMYAILLANAVSPHIDRLVRPKVFGAN